MPFAAAVSTHPVTAHATGEVIGQILDRLGPHPDLAFLFVSPGHAGAIEDAAATVRTLVAPTLLLGCASATVIGPGVEVEHGPAMTLWVGFTGPVAPLRIRGREVGAAAAPIPPPFRPQGLIVLADVRSFRAAAWLETMAVTYPALPIVGGAAAGRPWQGGTALLLDDQVFTSGAVAAFIGPGTQLTALVAQGCRPIGQPLIVTRSERHIVYELSGQPALRRLVEIARDQMPAREIPLINSGLHLGVVVGRPEVPLRPADFLMRRVMGADPANGAIAVGAAIEPGATVQFHVREDEAADRNLQRTLAGRRADGALLFAGSERGHGLFGRPDHDAGAVAEQLGSPALGGYYAVGEIGPAGGRNHLHHQSASLAVFSDMNNG